MVAAEPRIAMYDWQPGQAPAETSQMAPKPGITWVDGENPQFSDLWGRLEPLGLPGLQAQFVRHLCTNVDPSDPLASDFIDHFDAVQAGRLARGEGAHLLQAAEPMAVELGHPPDRRWSLAICRVGFLCGDGWLITYRSQSWDVRFGGSYEEVKTPSRRQLAEAARTYDRTDQTAQDVATLMVIRIARRATAEVVAIGDEIVNRAMDVHRDQVEESSSAETLGSVNKELFDLRWSLDAFERTTRPLLESDSGQGRIWFESAKDQARVSEAIKLLEEALRHARESRRALSDALVWLTNIDNSQILKEQVAAQQSTDRLQTLVSKVSVYVLGPALVASIFGAQPAWWDDHQEARTVLMIVLMVLVAVAGWAVVGRTTPRVRKIVRCELGTPVYGAPLKLGMQINRRIPEEDLAAPENDA